MATPEIRDITDFEDFTGHLEALKTVQIRARVSGYLDKIFFDDGAEVAKDAPLFQIDPRPYQVDLENKEALLVQSQRHVERLTSDFNRAQQMLSSKAISQEQFDQYRYDLIEAQATLLATIASRDMSKLNMDFTRVASPIAGKISRRMVDPGNMVVADTTPLTTIVSEDPIYAYFDVDEHTLLRLRRLADATKAEGKAAVAAKLALSDEQGFPHDGLINFIDNQVDPQTGTLRYRATFPNPNRLLSPGLFVRVRILIGDAHPMLVVPESALGSDQGARFLYVIDNKNLAALRYVKVGAQLDGGKRVVTDGLKSGERIVVDGLQRVIPGKLVNPKTVAEATQPPPAAGATPKAAEAPPAKGA